MNVRTASGFSLRAVLIAVASCQPSPTVNRYARCSPTDTCPSDTTCESLPMTNSLTEEPSASYCTWECHSDADCPLDPSGQRGVCLTGIFDYPITFCAQACTSTCPTGEQCVPVSGGESGCIPAPDFDTGAAGTCTADTDDATLVCGDSGTTIQGATTTQSGGPDATLWVLDSMTIQAGATLNVTGSKPAMFSVLGNVTIDGTVTITAGADSAGPDSSVLGAGVSGGYYGGSGAGSFCGTGGQGGSSMGMSGAAGMTYGTADLVPLVGGSSGAGFGGRDNSGGGGLEITAAGAITVGRTGEVSAGGTGGVRVDGAEGGEGAGSGGAILLAAANVTIAGVVAANGGGGSDSSAGGGNGTASPSPALGGGMGGAGSAGASIAGQNGSGGTGTPAGGGGGGAGRIRIDTTSGSAMITGTVSPALSTPCATQGTLAP